MRAIVPSRRLASGFLKKGQPIYAIYSEALLADENDFLLSLDQLDQAVAQKEIARQLLDAARKKLLLWTLSKKAPPWQ